MIKLIGKCIFVLLLINVLFWTIVIAALQTHTAQQWVLDQATAYLENKTQTKIQIKEFHFSFPLKLALEEISFSQKEQEILTIQKMEMSCSPGSLFQGRIVISQLQASDIDLYAIPFEQQLPGQKEPLESNSSFFPFYIKCKEIEIHHLRIAPSFLNTFELPHEIVQRLSRLNIHISGSMASNPFTSTLRAHLLLDTPSIRLSIDALNDQISLLLDAARPGFFLNGKALVSMEGEIRESRFQGEIEDLQKYRSFIDQGFAGKLIFTGSALGKIPSLIYAIELKSPELSIHGKKLTAIDSHIRGMVQERTLKGQVNLSLGYKNIPLTAVSTYHLNEEKRLTLSELAVCAMKNSVNGELACSLDDFILEGMLEGKMKNLDLFSTVLNEPVAGEGRLNLKFFGVARDSKKVTQEIEVQFNSTDIGYKDLRADEVDVHFSLHSSKPGNSRLEVAIYRPNGPQGEMEELSGYTEFDSTASRQFFKLNGKALWKEDLSFSLEGTWQHAEETLEVLADRLTGHYGPYPLRLEEQALFSRSPEEFHLSNLRLQWGEAEIGGEYKQEQGLISAFLKTNAIPSELFHFAAPDLPISGRVSLQGNLEGRADLPHGEFAIDLHHVQIIENIFAEQPFIEGRILLSLHDRGIELRSQLTGIGQTPLIAAGNLPIKFSLEPFVFKIDGELPFDLTLNAQGELDPYLHLFYNNDNNNLSGHADIALRFTGKIASPLVAGRITLTNGTYESLKTGAIYRHVRAILEGDGSRLVLKDFFAEDNKNGHLTGSGTIALDAAKKFPFEFHIEPSQIYILDSDYAQISASGQLILAGNTEQAALKGELTIDQATVQLEGALPRQIKRIDIQYINTSPHTSSFHPPEKRKANLPIELDIKLNALHPVRILDTHLKSTWKGELNITGTDDNPGLLGDLRIIEGEYDLKGKIFNITQGNIHFGGAIDKKTTLYVVASKEIDQITAEIIVKGAVNKPVMSFRSNPPLSQREVLSYILFGRGISDISPDEGSRLSQSFISLNAGDQTLGEYDFLSRLRNNIGIIDRLEFTTMKDREDNTNFGLEVGKHISKNVTVTIKQGTATLTPIIAIEAKLRKNIKAEIEAGGVAGENEDSRIPVRTSIKWKHDY